MGFQIVAYDKTGLIQEMLDKWSSRHYTELEATDCRSATDVEIALVRPGQTIAVLYQGDGSSAEEIGMIADMIRRFPNTPSLPFLKNFNEEASQKLMDAGAVDCIEIEGLSFTFLRAALPFVERLAYQQKLLGYQSEQRKRAIEALEQKEKQLRELISKAPFPLKLIAEDGEIILLSDSWVNTSGYSRKELKTDLDWVRRAFPGAEKESIDELRERFKLTTLESHGEVDIRYKDGTKGFWNMRTVPMGLLPDGRKAVLSMGSDVTSLRKALDQAERASQSKSNFLAVMSHELRTPLNPIVGLMDLIRESIEDKELIELIDVVDGSAQSLLRLIDNILDYSQSETGELNLTLKPTDMNAVIEKMVNKYKLANRDKVPLINAPFELPEGWFDATVTTDRERIEQILECLLDNSFKFTHKGHISIKSGIQPSSDHTGNLWMIIEDSGIGISEKAQKTIFEPFVQEDSSFTRKYGGTGIGLAITKRLVTALDGTIEVSSTKGEGTSFTVSIPVSKEAMSNVTRSPFASKKDSLRGHVLIAEDDPVNVSYLSNLLQTRNFAFTLTNTGKELLETYSEAPDMYDLLLVDLNMPEMNGIDATAEIRKLGGIAETVPIIAVTANVTADDRRRCTSVGMNDFLGKPFRPGDMDAVIDNWI